jgi:acetyltransferase-like isoleucine patch superfamily enzyme
MTDNLLTSIIRRIRPNYAPDPSVPTSVLIGWYARKGFFPLVRGILFRGRFATAGFPIFLGSRVTISYASSIRMGSSVFIGANTNINAFSKDGISIGSGCTIRENTWIQCSSSPANPGEGLEIGDNTYIGPGAVLGIGGPVAIGADCQIGAGFTVIAENHQMGPEGVSHSEVMRQGVTIGSGSWIGHRVTIVDGVILGAGCVVGAGTVVTKSFPANSTIVGVPGKALGSSTQQSVQALAVDG